MAEDVSILQEIDEALRADKAARFWARHSGVIIAFCVSVVLATAVCELWKNHRREVHERQTGKLAQAITLADAGKYSEAAPLYEQAEEDGGQLAVLAALKHAQALIDMKQESKAIAVYNSIAEGKQGETADIFRDYAALQADILAHNQALVSGKPPVPTEGGKEARVSSGNFVQSFAEIDALRSSDSKDASALLDGVISDRGTPLSQRMRAAEQLESIQRSSK